MNNYIKIGILSVGLIGTTFVGCKKDYLGTNPTNAVQGDQVYGTTDDAYRALSGIHLLMNSVGDNHRDFGVKASDLQEDVMGNDVVNTDGGGFDWFYPCYSYVAPRNPTNDAYVAWAFHYNVVNNANELIYAIDEAMGPDADRKDIKGQALAYRAWAFYRLVTRFSKAYMGGANANAPGIPLYLIPASQTSGAGVPRGTIQEVVDRMSSDINEAIALLSDGATAHAEKSHINLNVAHGIAARIAMYKWDYDAALTHANAAKEGYSLMSSAHFTSGMNNASNPEFMWCSTMTPTQTQETGIVNFISNVDETVGGYAGQTSIKRCITQTLYEEIQSSDRRKAWWIPSPPGTRPKYMQTKFKVKTAGTFECDNVYMRVAEMYLIAAEAAARLGRAGEANGYLQTFLNTRHTSSVSAPTSADAIIERVLWERRVELWLEGFGRLDLKERGLGLNRPVNDPASGLLYNHEVSFALTLTLPAGDNLFTFKLPLAEINANPSINPEDQNP